MNLLYITSILKSRKLLNIDSNDTLIITRRVHNDGHNVPVLKNLNTGAMVIPYRSEIKKFNALVVNLLETITDENNNLHKKLFTKNESIANITNISILNKTKKLSIHPLPPEKLTQLDTTTDDQIILKAFDQKYNDKEFIFKVSEDKKIFIKGYDEGYIYYLTDTFNKPTGDYFTATYTKEGFQLNYNPKYMAEEKVKKYFRRYTLKALENIEK